MNWLRWRADSNGLQKYSQQAVGGLDTGLGWAWLLQLLRGTLKPLMFQVPPTLLSSRSAE